VFLFIDVPSDWADIVEAFKGAALVITINADITSIVILFFMFIFFLYG